ncbi:hypothetical protein SNEBB_002941 [Seison nebaliae]|nr:hypothetical protein SNEBB_002941 [Seison nebaliae]
MDFSRCTDDNFDVADWINNGLLKDNNNLNSYDDDLMNGLICKFEMEIQDVNEKIDNSIKQVDTIVSELKNGVETVKKDYNVVGDVIHDVNDDIGNIKASQSTTMRMLVNLDATKQMLLQKSNTVQEAENWHLLDEELQEAFLTEDIENIVQQLIGMKHSLKILSELNDVTEETNHLEREKDRFERLIQKNIEDCLSTRNLMETQHFHTILSNLGRNENFEKVLGKSIGNRLLEEFMKWKNMEFDKLIQMYYTSLPKMYKDEFTFLKKIISDEDISNKLIIEIFINFIQSTINGISSNMRNILSDSSETIENKLNCIEIYSEILLNFLQSHPKVFEENKFQKIFYLPLIRLVTTNEGKLTLNNKSIYDELMFRYLEVDPLPIIDGAKEDLSQIKLVNLQNNVEKTLEKYKEINLRTTKIFDDNEIIQKRLIIFVKNNLFVKYLTSIELIMDEYIRRKSKKLNKNDRMKNLLESLKLFDLLNCISELIHEKESYSTKQSNEGNWVNLFVDPSDTNGINISTIVGIIEETFRTICENCVSYTVDILFHSIDNWLEDRFQMEEPEKDASSLSSKMTVPPTDQITKIGHYIISLPQQVETVVLNYDLEKVRKIFLNCHSIHWRWLAQQYNEINVSYLFLLDAICYKSLEEFINKLFKKDNYRFDFNQLIADIDYLEHTMIDCGIYSDEGEKELKSPTNQMMRKLSHIKYLLKGKSDNPSSSMVQIDDNSISTELIEKQRIPSAEEQMSKISNFLILLIAVGNIIADAEPMLTNTGGSNPDNLRQPNTKIIAESCKAARQFGYDVAKNLNSLEPIPKDLVDDLYEALNEIDRLEYEYLHEKFQDHKKYFTMALSTIPELSEKERERLIDGLDQLLQYYSTRPPTGSEYYATVIAICSQFQPKGKCVKYMENWNNVEKMQSMWKMMKKFGDKLTHIVGKLSKMKDPLSIFSGSHHQLGPERNNSFGGGEWNGHNGSKKNHSYWMDNYQDYMHNNYWNDNNRHNQSKWNYWMDNYKDYMKDRWNSTRPWNDYMNYGNGSGRPWGNSEKPHWGSPTPSWNNYMNHSNGNTDSWNDYMNHGNGSGRPRWSSTMRPWGDYMGPGNGSGRPYWEHPKWNNSMESWNDYMNHGNGSGRPWWSTTMRPWGDYMNHGNGSGRPYWGHPKWNNSMESWNGYMNHGNGSGRPWWSTTMRPWGDYMNYGNGSDRPFFYHPQPSWNSSMGPWNDYMNHGDKSWWNSTMPSWSNYMDHHVPSMNHSISWTNQNNGNGSNWWNSTMMPLIHQFYNNSKPSWDNYMSKENNTEWNNWMEESEKKRPENQIQLNNSSWKNWMDNYQEYMNNNYWNESNRYNHSEWQYWMNNYQEYMNNNYHQYGYRPNRTMSTGDWDVSSTNRGNYSSQYWNKYNQSDWESWADDYKNDLNNSDGYHHWNNSMDNYWENGYTGYDHGDWNEWKENYGNYMNHKFPNATHQYWNDKDKYNSSDWMYTMEHYENYMTDQYWNDKNRENHTGWKEWNENYKEYFGNHQQWDTYGNYSNKPHDYWSDKWNHWNRTYNYWNNENKWNHSNWQYWTDNYADYMKNNTYLDNRYNNSKWQYWLNNYSDYYHQWNATKPVHGHPPYGRPPHGRPPPKSPVMMFKQYSGRIAQILKMIEAGFYKLYENMDDSVPLIEQVEVPYLKHRAIKFVMRENYGKRLIGAEVVDPLIKRILEIPSYRRLFQSTTFIMSKSCTEMSEQLLKRIFEDDLSIGEMYQNIRLLLNRTGTMNLPPKDQVAKLWPMLKKLFSQFSGSFDDMDDLEIVENGTSHETYKPSAMLTIPLKEKLIDDILRFNRTTVNFSRFIPEEEFTIYKSELFSSRVDISDFIDKKAVITAVLKLAEPNQNLEMKNFIDKNLYKFVFDQISRIMDINGEERLNYYFTQNYLLKLCQFYLGTLDIDVKMFNGYITLYFTVSQTITNRELMYAIGRFSCDQQKRILSQHVIDQLLENMANRKVFYGKGILKEILDEISNCPLNEETLTNVISSVDSRAPITDYQSFVMSKWRENEDQIKKLDPSLLNKFSPKVFEEITKSNQTMNIMQKLFLCQNCSLAEEKVQWLKNYYLEHLTDTNVSQSEKMQYFSKVLSKLSLKDINKIAEESDGAKFEEIWSITVEKSDDCERLSAFWDKIENRKVSEVKSILKKTDKDLDKVLRCISNCNLKPFIMTKDDDVTVSSIVSQFKEKLTSQGSCNSKYKKEMKKDVQEMIGDSSNKIYQMDKETLMKLLNGNDKEIFANVFTAWNIAKMNKQVINDEEVITKLGTLSNLNSVQATKLMEKIDLENVPSLVELGNLNLGIKSYSDLPAKLTNVLKDGNLEEILPKELLVKMDKKQKKSLVKTAVLKITNKNSNSEDKKKKLARMLSIEEISEYVPDSNSVKEILNELQITAADIRENSKNNLVPLFNNRISSILAINAEKKFDGKMSYKEFAGRYLPNNLGIFIRKKFLSKFEASAAFDKLIGDGENIPTYKVDTLTKMFIDVLKNGNKDNYMEDLDENLINKVPPSLLIGLGDSNLNQFYSLQSRDSLKKLLINRIGLADQTTCCSLTSERKKELREQFMKFYREQWYMYVTEFYSSILTDEDIKAIPVKHFKAYIPFFNSKCFSPDFAVKSQYLFKFMDTYESYGEEILLNAKAQSVLFDLKFVKDLDSMTKLSNEVIKQIYKNIKNQSKVISKGLATCGKKITRTERRKLKKSLGITLRQLFKFYKSRQS